MAKQQENRPRTCLENIDTLLIDLQGSLLCSFCNRLQVVMGDKNKTYNEKIDVLFSVLQNVLSGNLYEMLPKDFVLLFEFIYRHTLSLVLHGDYSKNNILRFHMSFSFKRYETVARRKKQWTTVDTIGHLLDLLIDPWGNPTISKIINGEFCNEEDKLKLIKLEMGIVLISRLEIMTLAHCDSQALRLTEACLSCVSNPEISFEFTTYTYEIKCISDIHIFLLARTNSNTKLIHQLNQMGLGESLKLVRRYSKGQHMIGSLNKSCMKVAKVVALMALLFALLQPVTDETILQDMIEEWYNLNSNSQMLFHTLSNAFSVNAMSSHHIYLLVQQLVKKYGNTKKSLCIELYIRTLTANLNEMENNKSKSDHKMVKDSEAQLSSVFLSLADYLKEDVLTSRECVLTAFSLNPTESCHDKIMSLAIASGKLVIPHDQCQEGIQEDLKSFPCPKKNNQPNLSNTLLHHTQLTSQEAQDKTSVLSDCGKHMQSKFKVLPTPVCISDANKMGLSQKLWDDLLTVLGRARYNALNWHLDWGELRSRCESYMTSEKEARSYGKELKYLKLDYSRFKHCTNNVVHDMNINNIKKKVNYGEKNKPVECSVEVQTRIKENCALKNASSLEGYELSGIILVYKERQDKLC